MESPEWSVLVCVYPGVLVESRIGFLLACVQAGTVWFVAHWVTFCCYMKLQWKTSRCQRSAFLVVAVSSSSSAAAAAACSVAAAAAAAAAASSSSPAAALIF